MRQPRPVGGREAEQYAGRSLRITPCKVRNLSNSTVQKRGILERRGSLPPNLPLSPRTSPKSTRPGRPKIWFALYGAGALGGSFLFRAGGGNTLERAASRPVGGREAEQYAGCSLRITPCKVRNLSNSTVQKRGIVGNDPCVVPCRSNVTYRLTKECLPQVRQPRPAKNPHLPSKPKTSPVTPPLIKNETKFLPLSGGVMGEVLGGCGRFGGRGTPLSRGVPLPPRSFPYFTPHSSRKGAKEG